MALAGSSNPGLIRCPVCLNSRLVALSNPPGAHRCEKCGTSFSPRSALLPTPAVGQPKTGSASSDFAFSGGIAIIALVLAFMLGVSVRSFTGPEFTIFYLAILVVNLFVVSLWRWSNSTVTSNDMYISMYGFILHEGVAVTRLLTSQSPQPRSYGFLLGIMLLGGLAFFLRSPARSSNSISGNSSGCSFFSGYFSGGSSGASSCSSGSSGCGGGGGGGGGCGG